MHTQDYSRPVFFPFFQRSFVFFGQPVRPLIFLLFPRLPLPFFPPRSVVHFFLTGIFKFFPLFFPGDRVNFAWSVRVSPRNMPLFFCPYIHFSFIPRAPGCKPILWRDFITLFLSGCLWFPGFTPLILFSGPTASRSVAPPFEGGCPPLLRCGLFRSSFA